MKRIFNSIMVSIVVLVMCAGTTKADDVPGWMKPPREPFVYGAIIVSATCYASRLPNLHKQVRLFSEVFAYCEQEQSSDNILNAAAYNTSAAAKERCGTDDFILYGKFIQTRSTAQAVADDVKALMARDSGFYDRYGLIVYSNSVYSTHCK